MRDDDRENEPGAAPIIDPGDGGIIPEEWIPDWLKPKDRDNWTPGGGPGGDDRFVEGDDE